MAKKVKVKGHERRQGKLPPRDAHGKFSRRKRPASSSSPPQAALFKR